MLGFSQTPVLTAGIQYIIQTLAEALLVRAGAVPRAGKVDDGSSVLDTEPESTKRHMSLSLTLAPFDRRLIATGLLSQAERDWLDAYHARVLSEIGTMVDGETLKWLEAATAPLT